MLLLTSCQAISGDDPVATIDADLTMYASESDSIGAVGTAEQMMAVETIAAAGTRIAKSSAVNAALGATLRANHTGTPELRVAVVSAEDMGSSMEDGMMDDEAVRTAPESVMRVSDLSTAESTQLDNGCSTGIVSQFSPGSELIYVTARVTALQNGTLFGVEWQYDGRAVSHMSWLADFSNRLYAYGFLRRLRTFRFYPDGTLPRCLSMARRLGQPSLRSRSNEEAASYFATASFAGNGRAALDS